MSDTFRIYSNLLAQEGIDLKYSAKVATASFDFDTRKITLPAFEYLDTTSNQMMTAHEAGHALYSLYTLDQVKSHNRKYGSLFNILEDCYIEKEIKKSFPGLRQIFIDAYTSLFDNEFFGKIPTDVSTADMKLVDRINVHFKLGHMINVGFEFNEQFSEIIRSRGRDIFEYDNFSEGEKIRLDHAILFAFRELSRLRSSIHTNLLIFDESDKGTLDTDGFTAIKDIISTCTDENIILISHSPENFMDIADRSINVNKKNNFSVLEISEH